MTSKIGLLNLHFERIIGMGVSSSMLNPFLRSVLILPYLESATGGHDLRDCAIEQLFRREPLVWGFQAR